MARDYQIKLIDTSLPPQTLKSHEIAKCTFNVPMLLALRMLPEGSSSSLLERSERCLQHIPSPLSVLYSLLYSIISRSLERKLELSITHAKTTFREKSPAAMVLSCNALTSFNGLPPMSSL